MFESLDEQVKHDQDAATSKKERIVKLAAVVVISVAVFAGLYFGVVVLNQ